MSNTLMEYLSLGGFSNEHVDTLQRLIRSFDNQVKDETKNELSDKLFGTSFSTRQFCSDLSACAKEYPFPPFQFYLLFFLGNLEKLHALYRESQLDEELFVDLLKDFKLKNDSCLSLHGYCGVTSTDWYVFFFRIKRFALGRFHYDVVEFNHDCFCQSGVSLKRNDKVVTVHIPTGGKLTKEIRYDSYRKAYQFFQRQKLFSDGILKLVCHSWIFYGPYKDLYPKTSNLYDFTEDFTLLYNEEQKTFQDGWRIFGSKFNENPDDLPQETSLQKAFAQYMKQNDRFGVGYVVLLFDGEKILKA